MVAFGVLDYTLKIAVEPVPWKRAKCCTFWNNKNCVANCILFYCADIIATSVFNFYKDMLLTSDSQVQMDHRNEKTLLMESCLFVTSIPESCALLSALSIHLELSLQGIIRSACLSLWCCCCSCPLWTQ